MNKSAINFSLLDKSPLNEYERNLIRQIDIEDLPLKNVAGELKKADSTISLQHTKALEKYSAWYSKIDEETKTNLASGEEAAIVFEMLEKGVELPSVVIQTKLDPKKVKEHYTRWLEFKRVKIGSWDKFIEFLESHGQFNLENCKHNIDGYCMHWRWSEPPENITDNYKERDGEYYIHVEKWYCGLCNAFEQRPTNSLGE